MKLTVKLFAGFRAGRFKQQEMTFPDETEVQQIISSFDIALEEVGVTMINSRHCRMDQVPREGDILAIFPVIGGG